jgi:hypothetical protein
MSTKTKLLQQNPLIMRCHRLMDAFAKSDDERDFYLDRQEGFLIYADLDKLQEELEDLENELTTNSERYCAIPKLTFYEVKKIMEGFVNEKVYDIDTKEKLLDIIQSKEARENFLEFIYDHHSELEKWQQYYQEKFRIRIIEWLRNNQFDFVFEEDLEMMKSLVEKLKMNTFTPKAGKDIVTARKILVAKAKTYYSNEALNPRPKRGRPPKQVAKVETEPQFSQDIYLTVPKAAKPFLYVPDYQGTTSIFTFSGKYASEADLLAHKRLLLQDSSTNDAANISQKLATLRSISSQWMINSNEPFKTAVPASLAAVPLPSTATLRAVTAPPVREINGERDFGRTSDETDGFKGRPIRDDAILPKKKAGKQKEEKPQRAAAPSKASATKAPVKKAPANKPAAAKAPPAKKAKAKLRLRPLVKKNTSQAAKKESAEKKKKAPPLRHLRRSKKK